MRMIFQRRVGRVQRLRQRRGLMGLRQMWQDLSRIVRGIVAFVWYLRCTQAIDVAFGMFEAGSPTIIAGRSSRYVIRIANASEQESDVKLTVEIAPLVPQIHLVGSY